MQAVFSYENNIWFLKNCNSTNGTTLNGVKMEAGKKYQLTADDVISFAQAESMIFYKSEEHTNSFDEEKTKEILF